MAEYLFSDTPPFSICSSVPGMHDCFLCDEIGRGVIQQIDQNEYARSCRGDHWNLVSQRL